MTPHLRSLLRLMDPTPDAELLRRFVAARDGEAFASLVRRHGPMVLAVCRRILRGGADAEDAFQATFLVLARRAAVVRPQSLLANWLYGVAYRTALEARRAAVVRRVKEREAAGMRDVLTRPVDDRPELRESLDRELAALPDIYRVVIVLCDLEGLTRRDAAVRLGWSEGVVAGRLARGRGLLAKRLSRLGLVLPAGGIGAIAGTAGASVPVALTETITRAAAGEAFAVTGSVTILMEGVMKSFLLTKLKAAATALVVGCAVMMTATAGWQSNTAGAADQPKVAGATQKPARNPDKNRIAELELERDRLLKEVAELRDQVAKLIYERNVAAAVRKNQLNSYTLGLQRPSPPTGVPAPKSLDPLVLPKPVASPGTPSSDPPSSKPVVRVYSVSDLAANEKEGEALAKVVRAAVEPKSWGADAGVEYFPGPKALVIRQTAKGHDEVAELLKLLKVLVAPGGRR